MGEKEVFLDGAQLGQFELDQKIVVRIAVAVFGRRLAHVIAKRTHLDELDGGCGVGDFLIRDPLTVDIVS